MKTINFFKTVICLLALTLTFSCSSDDSSMEPIDTRSFITDSNVDYFINRDGTTDIIVTGEYVDPDSPNFGGDVVNRGFVYGTTSIPVVNSNNTESALGSNPVNATFRNLDAGQTIYIRGFFEMSDGTYFYGNEIQVSTAIDASSTRSIAMTIRPDLFFQNSDGITPELEVTAIEKESPVEIGFEYSLNSDFSNSSITLDPDMQGNIFLTIYSEFVTGLTSNTLYYFRPYAKYADGTTTNGGNSTATFTTN